YEHSVAPPAFVWTNIDKELRKRRQRKGFFWLLFALGLTASGLWAFNQRSAVSSQQSAGSSQQAVVSGQQAGETADLSSQRSLGTGSGQQAVVSGQQPGETADLSSQQSVGTETKNLSSQQSVGTETKNLSSQQSGGTESKNLSSQQSVGTETADLSSQPNVGTGTADLSSQQSVGTFSTFATLAPGDAGLDAWKRPSPEYPKVKPIVRRKQESKNCYDFDHMGTVWWLDAYVGPSLTRRQFNAKDSEHDNYLQQRLETETPDLAFNTGVRASMLFRENFVVRSGLHYDQFVEKFEWADPNSIEVNIRTYTQLVNGVWETVIDTLSIEYGDNYIKTYNRFGMVDIPLEMGIELRRGRTGVSINGGVSLNLLFWKRGAILSPDNNQPAYFTPEEGTIEVFKTNAGLSIGGSVQWFYHIKPTVRLFAEPYYRQILKPLTVDGHPVEQQYGIGGLKIGMTKILHGK
ncbi:MAG: hypothetical protein IT270_02870, partial [Saprospiraceae bacterium]|nr:hypothetical protein [Saprospiraceae bacterium]